MEKNKIMMIIIIVLLVVLLGTIVGVFFYTMQILKASQSEQNGYMATTMVQEIPKLAVNEISKIDLSTAVSTDLSISEDGGEHFIKLNVTIGYNNTDKKESPKIQELLEGNDAMNKDLVLGILRSKTYEDLKQPDGFDNLKDEVLTKLRDTYESSLIYTIYFSDIILQ